MSQVEAWMIAAWAVGVAGSFLFWLHLNRDTPKSERNDPFMLCMMWPATWLFLGGFIAWMAVSELAHAISTKARQ